jgi:succinate dehydrogenase / fumarate reductase membrane anchor subunit
LGSARSGTEHWWHERVSAVASIPTTLFLIVLGIALAGRDHAGTATLLGSPGIAITLALSLATLLWHMWLGMKVIIEDYVHGRGKIWLLIGNSFFVAVLAAASLVALFKLSAGTFNG